ncbi:copper amine oxidase N-terminal domain-containing protein [Brevibacillus agri]|uniref:copper amine oxidase N-terminal domain-containing protein n=1 Tax=Brevibacillus TaxID=55080 RepID=UPI001562125D|nr:MULTISPECIES: copper amine oxidase N-terminal domain-containing protein [Brevibacillus]MBE5393698.1 copper amine oxidase N-terminal domain-containing protein [Brevibacillus borstelensis]MED1645986.1 copper amine oxidase N-terminal domain-containing protein [Brevibacillus agri]MED1656299.1 copper amine oxidase N-terminal domain-containing protein [Brevibacillus agri]MED1689221.1 copper amine oxidase N-terminal domain-containing protein [Brevibacillus agri]MED1693744.1 copper amine oxidase N-
MITQPSTTIPSIPVFYVNGKDVTSQGEPTERAGVLYVPVESVVKGMGDSFTWAKKPYTANVKTGSGKKIMITVGKSVVIVDGKNVPVSTLQLKGTTVPMQAKPIVVNNMIYVPYDFFKTVMGYPVEFKKQGNKTLVIVGDKGIVQEGTGTTPSNPTTPSPAVKDDPRYPFPKGWTPPQIKSAVTPDKQKNMEILANELGFTNLGAGADFRADGTLATTAIGVSANDRPYETMITIKYWTGSEYTPWGFKVPYIARELFKFYLSQNGDQLWKIIDDGYNGKDVSKYIGNKFTLDNREIKILETSNAVVIVLGKPGVKYDSNWNVIK